MLVRADSQQGMQGDADGYSPLMDSVASSRSSGPSQVLSPGWSVVRGQPLQAGWDRWLGPLY